SPSERGSSHFSLTEIKKKLKNAIGRERHGKGIGKDNVGMRSPNKDHFFIEKIARPSTGVTKGNKTGKNKDSEAVVDREKGNEDENTDSSSRLTSKTLGRIISFPDYNFSPLNSPVRDWEDRFVTAKRRLHGESYNSKSQEIKSDSNFSDGIISGDKEENRDEIVTEGDVESTKDVTIIESSSEPVGLSVGNEEQSHNISESSDCAGFSQCLEQVVSLSALQFYIN
ncbi:phosphatidylinositol N-acetyglucosaminlytransferase subunit P-like, partial [Trifolium medium]|nr:phosphatidylinositol N-acetyglucosaminlytransferase subunit P-like [Trifolium medium]